jgi:hypothetical protein
MGASGFVITLQALGTSTSRMALRLSLLAMDREPNVATSLVSTIVSRGYDHDYGHAGDASLGDLPDGGDAMLRRGED